MKKLNFILSLVFILALAACNKTGGSVPSPSSSESSNQALAYNELAFEVLENDQGLPENMTESIGSIRVFEGFAYFKAEDEYVVFIGMGKKPTGGYGIEVKTVEDIEGLTKITVEEKSPQNGDVVTQALTYPYVLVKIKGCAENFEVATVTQEKLPLIEIKTDSGRYQGLADNNFIEIKISGVPDEKSSRVFQLSEELKENFEQLKLKKDDDIKFCYMENAGANPVIIEIQPLAIQTMEVAVYYLKSNENEVYLVREVHQVKKSERVALAALNELIQGVPIDRKSVV